MFTAQVGNSIDNLSMQAHKGFSYYLGAAVFFSLGIGDNLQGTDLENAYYIISGLHIGYAMLGGALLLAIAGHKFRTSMISVIWKKREYIFLVSLLSFWLMVSTLINISICGGSLEDLLPCARILYFILIIAYVACFTIKFGPLSVIKPFLAGVSAVAVERVFLSFTSPDAIVVANDLPVIRDPNVVGALVGCGLAFCALGLLYGAKKYCTVLSGVLLFASVFTFSKGAWIMSLLGCVACISAYNLRKKTCPNIKSSPKLLNIFIVAGIVYIVYTNLDSLIDYFYWKIYTTDDNQSVSERLNFALAGLRLMLENPILGVGFRNYPVAKDLYPELFPGTVDNAHNLFAQIAAVAGLPALIIVVYLFFYPFAILKKIFDRKNIKSMAFVLPICGLFFVYANVQLQLIAQPLFWVFVGIVFGLNNVDSN